MSYRERATRKGRRAKTPRQLRRESSRDRVFCERRGIPWAVAWRWARYPLENYRP
jgi:hypothetical protein